MLDLCVFEYKNLNLIFTFWIFHFALEMMRYNDIINKNQYSVNDPEQMLSLPDLLFISSFCFFSTVIRATPESF